MEKKEHPAESKGERSQSVMRGLFTAVGRRLQWTKARVGAVTEDTGSEKKNAARGHESVKHNQSLEKIREILGNFGSLKEVVQVAQLLEKNNPYVSVHLYPGDFAVNPSPESCQVIYTRHKRVGAEREFLTPEEIAKYTLVESPAHLYGHKIEGHLLAKEKVRKSGDNEIVTIDLIPVIKRGKCYIQACDIDLQG